MTLSQVYFTIVVPVFNRASIVSGVIKKVLSQTFTQFELIIVDDGSTDQTGEVVQSFKDDRIRYIFCTNRERGAARNLGWFHARGKYITFLDSDDLVWADHLEAAFLFAQKTNCTVFAQAYEIVDVYGNVQKSAFKSNRKTINQKLLQGNVLSCFGVFIMRDECPQIRFAAHRSFAGSEDWLLWLRLAARFPIYYNNQVTGALVQHAGRSVLHADAANLWFRAAYMRLQLLNDNTFVSVYGKKAIKRIYGHMLSYGALHLAIGKLKFPAFFFMLKSFWINPKEIFTRRVLATLYLLFFSSFRNAR